MITAIKNVRIFNGEALTELTNVVFDKGYITSIGPAVPEFSEEFNAKGATLLPGYIDTHIHIDSRNNCVLAVQSGITTLVTAGVASFGTVLYSTERK